MPAGMREKKKSVQSFRRLFCLTFAISLVSRGNAVGGPELELRLRGRRPDRSELFMATFWALVRPRYAEERVLINEYA